jgi:pantoate--beta-alanine ligase
MRTLRSIAAVRAHVGEARSRGARIGLVPTMGAFHAGHAALMRAAREQCDEVVVSLFVNPAQFEEPGDLAAYPRGEEQDAAIAERLGVDVLFAPPVEEIYPDGFSTRVVVDGLGDVLEGEQRGRAHFAGVCTVVAKLLNIVAPDVAYFGQKDAQQVVVLRRMVRDLDLPVALAVIPTVRDPDGLALSSRNARLSPPERRRALALSRALRAAEHSVAAGERDAERIRGAALAELAPDGIEPEYLALVHPETLEPVQALNGRVLVAVAARVGSTRLIDNTLVQTPGGDPPGANH